MNLTNPIISQEETGDYPDDVMFSKQELDVAWYGRFCSKHIRDTVHSQEPSDKSKGIEYEERKLIEKGFPGSKFCTSHRSRYNVFLDYDDLSPLDQCCKKLLLCPTNLSPFNYQYLT